MLTKVVCAIAVCLAPITSAAASSISISLNCRTEPQCDVRGDVVFRSAADDKIVRRVPFNGKVVQLGEAAGSEWNLRLDAKGFWALPLHITFPKENAPSAYALSVWRTGTLHGKLKLPEGEQSRAVALKVAVVSRPEPRIQPEIPRGTSFDCAVETSADWKCVVPATSLDVALRLDGYAPFHKWDVKTPPGGAVDLGVVKLQKGATLVAWLDGDFAKRVSVPVHAALRHDVLPAASATAMRLALPIAEGDFMKKGVVQLGPVSPGRYVFEAEAKGYAPVRLAVELYDGRETTPRKSVELLPALDIQLHLNPPLDPGNVAWRVEVWRDTTSGSGSSETASGFASREGVFSATGLAEGVAHVYVKDSKSNVLARRDVTITSGVSDYTIDIDVNRISGKVTLGDTPLRSAQLLFGGSGGAEKVRVVADAEGRFVTSLPRRGKWIVDVVGPLDDVAATTEVTVATGEVNIALPSTEISGWVSDANGQRLPGARVTMLSDGRPMMRVTDGEGAFRFRGAHSGSVRLRASDPRTHDYSKYLTLIVPEDGALRSVQLNLESVKPLKGIVRSDGQTVVGALVHGYAFLAGTTQQEQAMTDIEGRFTFDVPSSASQAVVVVGSPGRTMQAFAVSTDQDSVSLDLSPHGGRLEVQWKPGDLPLRFAYNDVETPSSDLFTWARAQGARIVDGAGEIPNVAPGKYEFCSASHCARGFLAVGGSLTLDATH
jgi:hypothetical protein